MGMFAISKLSHYWTHTACLVFICLRKTTSFFNRVIPDAMCFCGYPKSQHENINRRFRGMGKWSKESNTTAATTNAFGEIEFVGYGGNIGKASLFYDFYMLITSCLLVPSNAVRSSVYKHSILFSTILCQFSTDRDRISLVLLYLVCINISTSDASKLIGHNWLIFGQNCNLLKILCQPVSG